jgi:hypothetical protein
MRTRIAHHFLLAGLLSDTTGASALATASSLSTGSVHCRLRLAVSSSSAVEASSMQCLSVESVQCRCRWPCFVLCCVASSFIRCGFRFSAWVLRGASPPTEPMYTPFDSASRSGFVRHGLKSSNVLLAVEVAGAVIVVLLLVFVAMIGVGVVVVVAAAVAVVVEAKSSVTGHEIASCCIAVLYNLSIDGLVEFLSVICR